jgi:hypothetical protein
MSTEIDEAIDWLGAPLDCGVCAHLGLRETKKCQPLRACVFDRYARRVDRFFDWNPDLAGSYLRHPYFEVRACAAKAADIFLLPPMLSDPEEAVRWSAARRLPKSYLLKLRDDPHREVRIRVAQRLDPPDLRPMISDADYAVRQVVARRISVDLLILMVRDLDVEVRRAVRGASNSNARAAHFDRRRGGEHSRRGGAAYAGGRAARPRQRRRLARAVRSRASSGASLSSAAHE